jgi:hypothetical protein
MLTPEDLKQVGEYIEDLLAVPSLRGKVLSKMRLSELSAEEKVQLAKDLGVSTTTVPVSTTPAPAPTPTPAPAPTATKPVADPGKYEPNPSNSRQLFGKPDGASYAWRYIEGPGFDGWWNNSDTKQNATMNGVKVGTHKVGLTVTVNGVKSDEATISVIRS